jgi:hypothetical protein
MCWFLHTGAGVAVPCFAAEAVPRYTADLCHASHTRCCKTSSQQNELLPSLLQMHSADATGQPTAAAAAAAAVQQAELVLLKCKAATAAAAAAQQTGNSSGRPVSSSSSLLFELAGVHCCSADNALGKPARKVRGHKFVG